MGASYLGTYSKTFQASSMDGSYRRKSTAATHAHLHIVREDNNMAGEDVDYAHKDSYIHSPIQFEKQSDRKPFNKFGVFGP